eukprot:gene36224-43940_t
MKRTTTRREPVKSAFFTKNKLFLWLPHANIFLAMRALSSWIPLIFIVMVLLKPTCGISLARKCVSRHLSMCQAYNSNDERFMKLAIRHAQHAYREKEVPVGAVIVDENGVVIAASRNRVEETHDATAHAEVDCMRKAALFKQNWRLLNCTLYTTLEPCPVCLSAAQSFRIKRVVYAAKDLRLGACGSHINLAGTRHPFHQLNIEGGVLNESSVAVYVCQSCENMATHECTGCLALTVQGAGTVEPPFVLANSTCSAQGGRHTWVRLTDIRRTLLYIRKKVDKIDWLTGFQNYCPWLDMAETDRSRTRNLRDKVFSKLRITDATATCWVTRKHVSVKAAHILPDSSKNRVLERLQLNPSFRNDVDAVPNNFIILDSQLEEAFDSMKISFSPLDVLHTDLRLKIWDPACRNDLVGRGSEEEMRNDIELYGKELTTIGDYEGFLLNIPGEWRVSRRALSYHNLCCYIYQKYKGNMSIDENEPADFSSQTVGEGRDKLRLDLAQFYRSSIRQDEDDGEDLGDLADYDDTSNETPHPEHPAARDHTRARRKSRRPMPTNRLKTPSSFDVRMVNSQRTILQTHSSSQQYSDRMAWMSASGSWCIYVISPVPRTMLVSVHS